MHNIQSSLYLFFCYIIINCINLCDFLQLCENYIRKRQEGENVKAHYEFGNDSMKVCFKHKTRMKVDHKIKIVDSRIIT
jgi:hypothetical protein